VKAAHDAAWSAAYDVRAAHDAAWSAAYAAWSAAYDVKAAVMAAEVAAESARTVRAKRSATSKIRTWMLKRIKTLEEV
jgi:hypothetical protein